MHTAISIQQGLLHPDAVALIHQWLQLNPQQNRRALTQYVCESLHSRDARGQCRIAGTAKSLNALAAKALWQLPAPCRSHLQSRPPKPRRLGHPVPPPQHVPKRAEQVQGLKLVLVNPKQDELLRIWNELIETEHACATAGW